MMKRDTKETNDTFNLLFFRKKFIKEISFFKSLRQRDVFKRKLLEEKKL